MAWRWPTIGRKQLTSVQAVPSADPTGEIAQRGIWVDVSSGGSVAVDRTTVEMLEEYTRSIYLWRCVDLIAGVNGSVPLYVSTPEDRALTRQESELQTLLAKPNPQWTLAALMYFLAASLAVANRSYLKRVRGVAGKTLELWPIPADAVANRYVKGSEEIAGYEIQVGNKKEFYPVMPDGDCDIIYIARPFLNPKADKSPAAVSAPPAEVFSRILQRCADIVNNSSNVTGVLSTEAEVGEPAIQKVKDKLMSFRTGGSQSGGTVVTGNAKWNFTRLSDDPTSALSVDIKDSLARDVAMTFGVPTQLVGLKGNDTYNNMNTARVSFLTETVLPGYTNIIISALAAMLCQGMNATIAPDLDALPAMAQARLALVETAAKADMLSINEQRELMGYPPYEDEMADIPRALEAMRVARLNVEMGMGEVDNELQDEKT